MTWYIELTKYFVSQTDVYLISCFCHGLCIMSLHDNVRILWRERNLEAEGKIWFIFRMYMCVSVFIFRFIKSIISHFQVLPWSLMVLRLYSPLRQCLSNTELTIVLFKYRTLPYFQFFTYVLSLPGILFSLFVLSRHYSWAFCF